MKTTTLIIASVYGMLSIILGAFGAHLLKKILTPDRLESFETGVRYQMYASFFLLIIGFFLKFDTLAEKWASWLMIIGTLLFSGSIYLLSFQNIWNVNLKFLGPITPLGGLMMILSWGILLYYFIKNQNITI